MSFSTSYEDILQQVKAIDPISYGKTRNYGNGAVTRLSPYISRGVISAKQVMNHVLSLGLQPYQVQKLLQELAWRDYWQQIWIAKGDVIDTDLKRPQPEVENHSISRVIIEANTGVNAVDKAITDLYETGYMHNHMRMYTAALACNAARSHWLLPARWMYYHLLDGDWASNALSWQWVGGSNSGKKYIANQENINKYFDSNQIGTLLDIPYEKIASMPVPETMKSYTSPNLETHLPEFPDLSIDSSLPTCIYNTYNLDPEWLIEKDFNRVLLLEPSHFEKYPISDQVLSFILALAKNIPSIQVFVGEFHALQSLIGESVIHYKEHPTATHYEGIIGERDWMFSIRGYYPSFFNFWKKCKKELPSP